MLETQHGMESNDKSLDTFDDLLASSKLVVDRLVNYQTQKWTNAITFKNNEQWLSSYRAERKDNGTTVTVLKIYDGGKAPEYYTITTTSPVRVVQEAIPDNIVLDHAASGAVIDELNGKLEAEYPKETAGIAATSPRKRGKLEQWIAQKVQAANAWLDEQLGVSFGGGWDK